MRRRRSQAGQEIIQLLARIPWWVSVLAAVFSYLVLHSIASSPMPKTATPGQMSDLIFGSIFRGLALAGQYFVPLVLVMGALSGIVGRREASSLVQKVAKSPGATSLNAMSWSQFERLVGETLRRMGYQVVENGGGGADGGIDLHATRDGARYIVQCKQWRTYRVGVSVVREHFGVMTAERAAGGFVVTSGRFTQEALDFAVGKPIQLIDGEQLSKAVVAVSQSEEPQCRGDFAKSPVSSTKTSAPSCPVCQKEMVVRLAKQGSKAGKSFWGCRQFPNCRGVRAI